MSPAEIVDELEDCAHTRHEALLADPPSDGKGDPPRTPGRIGWNWETLLNNRVVDVWMHEQDIRRATGRPGGFDSPAARHTVAAFGRALPMVVGKRVAPPEGTTVRVDVPEAEQSWTVAVGDDGRATRSETTDSPTVRITLSAEDFVVLAGGRRPLEATTPKIEGDADLGRAVLASLAVTP
jgi:uncharacterized protein (TIGR03083 family)